jgi:hypothetical protein
VKVIAKTDEYTIYQKRNERYAVRDARRAWINGDAKVAILREHKLIEIPAPKAPAPEPAEDAAAAADSACQQRLNVTHPPPDGTPTEALQ